ncbi:MAG: hypothetical protein ACR2MG_02910 [Pyrinomonadaceae bacterium]
MISIPNRFLVNGRPTIKDFEPNESLYFRFSSEHFPDETRLPVAAIRFPDFSVNAGSLSQPSDVLIPHWINLGIAELKVSAIPLPLRSDDKNDEREFSFKACHDPIDETHPAYSKQQFENYAHTEIRAFLENEHFKKDPPKSVRKKFRLILSDATKIIIILLPASKT